MKTYERLTICLECGWKSATSNPPENTCWRCGGELYHTKLDFYEKAIIEDTSEDREFLLAMAKLKEEDIIEFNVKYAPMKMGVEQKWEENRRRKALANAPKCPKCGSIHITTGSRGVSGFWGFIGASKTVNRCSSCGHTWKPR